jgi:NADPH-dependent 2,4-dienoyl-CoA reductase/sulfur reductase-like enzyme
MKIVIIGGSFGGVSCAVEARKIYPKAEILLIEKKAHIGFIPSGLLLYLEGKITSLKEAFFCSKEQLEKLDIQVALQETMETFDPKEHLIQTDRRKVTYDRLVLAAGSAQESELLLPTNEASLTYKDYGDAKQLVQALEQASTITIVGAGQAGMEAASALTAIGKQVHLIESMTYPLFKYFDQSFLQPFLQELAQIKNLQLYLSESSVAVERVDAGFQVVTANRTLVSDLALTTVNVRPRPHPAFQQLRLHSDHTIWTDPYLETSEKDVFAVGDLIQLFNPITQDTAYMPLVNNAVRSGIAAAQNLEEKQAPFRGGLRTVGTQLFGWYLASTGMTESDRFFYEKEIAVKNFTARASLIDTTVIYGKLIIEKASGQVLGAQLISKYNLLEKINLLAYAIEKKSTLEELAQKDFFFHPYFTNVIELANGIALGSDADEI